jgi:hypothetical protein
VGLIILNIVPCDKLMLTPQNQQISGSLFGKKNPSFHQNSESLQKTIYRIFKRFASFPSQI